MAQDKHQLLQREKPLLKWSDPRQNSRGFEMMDALPLSICLGKRPPANPMNEAADITTRAQRFNDTARTFTPPLPDPSRQARAD